MSEFTSEIYVRQAVPFTSSVGASPKLNTIPKMQTTRSQMMPLVKLVKGTHRCRFRSELFANLPRPPPYASLWSKLGYQIQKMMIVDRSHPTRKFYFHSEYTLNLERHRQLTNPDYKYTIHPFSRFNLWREIFFGILYLVCLVITPLHDTFLTNYLPTDEFYPYTTTLRMVYSWLFFGDIILNFFVGYQIAITKEVELDLKMISRSYLKSHFILDVVATVYSITYTMVRLMGPDGGAFTYVAPLGFLRFFRSKTLMHTLTHVMHFYGVSTDEIRLINLIIACFLFMHWWTCVLYFGPAYKYYLTKRVDNSYVIAISMEERYTKLKVYLDLLLVVISHFFASGKASMLKPNTLERFILALCSMTGMICYFFVVTLILQMYGIEHTSEIKYNQMILEVNNYINEKRLGKETKNRLLTYYKYRFQGRFFNEFFIKSSLSEHLRCEIKLYNCRNLVKKLQLLQKAPNEAIGMFLGMLNHEIYLAGDVIIRAHQTFNDIYFISTGTAMVVIENREYFHLSDGQHFGELDLFLSKYSPRPPMSIEALEVLEVYYLSKEKFMWFLYKFPEIHEIAIRIAYYKEAAYRLNWHGIHFQSTNEIINQLRRQQILEQKKERKERTFNKLIDAIKDEFQSSENFEKPRGANDYF